MIDTIWGNNYKISLFLGKIQVYNEGEYSKTKKNMGHKRGILTVYMLELLTTTSFSGERHTQEQVNKVYKKERWYRIVTRGREGEVYE